MNPIQKLEWLQDEIDKIVERYKDESNRYKKQALRLKIVSVFLASLITIFLRLKLNNSEIVSRLSPFPGGCPHPTFH